MWYEAVSHEAPLTQGDIVRDCPLIAWAEDANVAQLDDEDDLVASVEQVRGHVIVMTQACDLENEKVTCVLLCPVYELSEYRRAWESDQAARRQNVTPKAWATECNGISNGARWNLAMLNRGEASGLNTEHLVVDFSKIFTVPKQFLVSTIGQRRLPRLRLCPPYREHLSQAFARYFMRVGLPTPIDKMW